MTNREKFKEIFGFDLNTDELHCIAKGSCKDCPLAFIKGQDFNMATGKRVSKYDYKYEECTDFWDDEYVEHDCTTCKYGDTDGTELPCIECGTGSENKWEEKLPDVKTNCTNCKYSGILCKHFPCKDCSRSSFNSRRIEDCTDNWEPVNEDCTKDCHKYDMDSKEPPCEDCKLSDESLKYAEADAEMSKKYYNAILACRNTMNTMERCMDNYDSILKLHVRKIENLEKQLLNRFYGTDNMKPFDTTPMCDIHKDGILGRVGD